jgi:hypothetical protein
MIALPKHVSAHISMKFEHSNILTQIFVWSGSNVVQELPDGEKKSYFSKRKCAEPSSSVFGR